MKFIVLAALLLVPQIVYGANLTEHQVGVCVSTRDTAVIVYTKKQEGVPKSQLYQAIASEKRLTDTSKNGAYAIIDVVYRGNTPDQLFDLCLEVAKEMQEQSKQKSSRIDL